MNAALAEFLRGAPVAWNEVGVTERELLEICENEDLTGLLQRRVHASAPDDWPATLVHHLDVRARADTAAEMLRRQELTAVLSTLTQAGIRPVLFKGSALAYLVYDAPTLRPRNDTDLLIRREDVDPVRKHLRDSGYTEPAYCDGELVFCQFEMQKNDAFGVVHALDFHWKISMQTLFADLLGYPEILAESVAIPALGEAARGAGPVHALLIACIHPAMHHRGMERIIWRYDIHLLASRLTSAEWDRFAETARAKGVAAICGHELRSAREQLGTTIPERVIDQLASVGTSEATVAYLAPDRRWGDELVANVRGLKTWRDRMRLLREVAFPSAAYMLKSYRLNDGIFTRALLPALYAHRGVTGMLKVLRGSK